MIFHSERAYFGKFCGVEANSTHKVSIDLEINSSIHPHFYPACLLQLARAYSYQERNLKRATVFCGIYTLALPFIQISKQGVFACH